MLKKISLVFFISLFCLTAKACPFSFGDKVVTSCLEIGFDSEDGYYLLTTTEVPEIDDTDDIEDEDPDIVILPITNITFFIPKALAKAGTYPIKILKSNLKEDSNSCASETKKFQLPSNTAVYMSGSETTLTLTTKNISIVGRVMTSGTGTFTVNSAVTNTNEIGLSNLDIDSSFDFSGTLQNYSAKAPVEGLFSCKDSIKRTKVRLGAKSSQNLSGEIATSILLPDQDNSGEDGLGDDDSGF